MEQNKEDIIRNYALLEAILKKDNSEICYEEILSCYKKIEHIHNILKDNQDKLELIIPDSIARHEITKILSTNTISVIQISESTYLSDSSNDIKIELAKTTLRNTNILQLSEWISKIK